MNKQQRIEDDAAKKAALKQRKNQIKESTITDLDYFLMGITSTNDNLSEMDSIKKYLDSRDINMTEFDYSRFLLFDPCQTVKDSNLLMGICQHSNPMKADLDCTCCGQDDIDAAELRTANRKLL